MSSWFGDNNKNKDNGDEEEHENMQRASEDSRRREPNERDRLLPDNNRPGSSRRRRPQSDGYLDPDDPAVSIDIDVPYERPHTDNLQVSPYNLWTVRVVRYFTIIFLVVTFLWWVLLLVSIFVSPPGLNSRGSGFFDFSYTTLTLGILLCSLLFFSAPSMAMRVCQGLIAIILVADLIIIAVTPRIRAEEGPPGIASVVWATVITLWCVATDRIVTWGKHEEEERLTGRAETRRTLREWVSVLTATVILIVYIVIAAFMTATLVLRTRDASLEFDGGRYAVDDGKYEVHLACIGNVTQDENGNRMPTILLESAESPLEYDFEHFLYNAYQNGTINRYCYWDRPGYAWSDNAPSPHSAGMCAENLAEALVLKDEPGPYILVSGGYGSIVSRIFSSRHYSDVSGIMMVDPLHEDLLNRVGKPSRGFLLWGWGVISPLGIQRIGGALFKGRTREDRVYGTQAFQSGKFIKAQLQENLVAESFTKSEIATARSIQTPDTPLVIVSSGKEIDNDSDWKKKQEQLTGITDNLLSWDVVDNAPHFVWQNYDGRTVLEKRLGELMKKASKNANGTMKAV